MNNLQLKIGLDTTIKLLFGLGVMGLGLAIYDNGERSLVIGLLGAGCVVLGFGLQIYRNWWNEKVKHR